MQVRNAGAIVWMKDYRESLLQQRCFRLIEIHLFSLPPEAEHIGLELELPVLVPIGSPSGAIIDMTGTILWLILKEPWTPRRVRDVVSPVPMVFSGTSISG